MMEQTTAPAKYVTKIGVKLLEFQSFGQKSAFKMLKSLNTDHVVLKLPQNIMISVSGLILNSEPSTTTPFEGSQGQASVLIHPLLLAASF